jgi:hypothetical protein
VLQLARDAGFTVEEADIPVKDALAADEVFTTGMQPQWCMAWTVRLLIHCLAPNSFAIL